MSETIIIPIDELRRLISEAVAEGVRQALDPEPKEGPLSLNQAAESIGVSVRTVRRLVERKRLRPLRIGGRVLIPRNQIEAILREAER